MAFSRQDKIKSTSKSFASIGLLREKRVRFSRRTLMRKSCAYFIRGTDGKAVSGVADLMYGIDFLKCNSLSSLEQTTRRLSDIAATQWQAHLSTATADHRGAFYQPRFLIYSKGIPT